MHKSWMHMNDLFINIQIENWDVTNIPPLIWTSSSRFGLASKKVWVVLSKIFFSFPSGFFLHMITPLNLTKLDNSTLCDLAGKLENLHWFLLVGQITIQLNRFQWHCISQWYLSHLCVALLQLGNVKYIMNSWQSFRQFQLVSNFSHTFQNFVSCHKTWW